MSVRIESASLTVEQISALAGVVPTDSARKGEPTNVRNPHAPERATTYWTFDVGERIEPPLAPVLERLRPLLARLAAAEPVDESRDIVVMLDGAMESGDRLVIDREHVRLMARARSGLLFDVFNESVDDD